MLRFKPTKLSLALFTVHLFNPVDPLNVSGLAKGSQKITLKTTRLVERQKSSMKSERNDHVAKSASGKREIDTTFHSDLRCRSSSPPPSPNPQSEKQSMLPNQVIRTGRSKLVSNQGPCRLVIFASELSPDVFTLQVKNGHLRQN